MADVTRKRVVRLGVILAVVLATVALSVPALCEDAKDTDAKEAPSTKAEDEKPGDLWIDLLEKQGKDAELRRILIFEWVGESERWVGESERWVEESEKLMEELLKKADEMRERMREMERGVPHRRRQPPRVRDFEGWGRPPDIDKWLKEFEREFRFRLDPDAKGPFRFHLEMMRPGDAFFSLRMDTKETDEAYVYTLDVPGMKKEDIAVELDDHVLTVSGERKEQVEEKQRDGKMVRREISYGRFERRIELPQDADTDKVTSKYADGVLTITAPKKEKEEAESKRIIIHHP